MILIAEIGNCHTGDFQKAKQMVKIAKESGASLVKMQAFNPDDINGSMSRSFYAKCAFPLYYYIELINYGKEIGIPVFYSIFSKELLPLVFIQKYIKFAGSQVTEGNLKLIDNLDMFNVFISVPENKSLIGKMMHSYVLHVSNYLTATPNLERINEIKKFFCAKDNYGYSDHTIGIDACITAKEEYDVKVIEKHFVLEKDYNNITHNGKTFRDCVHAATPKQFEQLARMVK